jgi:hypothetical protein
VLRIPVVERGVFRAYAIDCSAQVLDRDGGEKPGNSSGEEVHDRVNGVIAERRRKPGFQYCRKPGWKTSVRRFWTVRYGTGATVSAVGDPHVRRGRNTLSPSSNRSE